METPTIPRSILQMVQAIEPEDHNVTERARVILDTHQSLPPEQPAIIDRTLATQLSLTTTVRKLIQIFEENKEMYKLGGIGMAYLHIFRMGISFLCMGREGKPKGVKSEADVKSEAGVKWEAGINREGSTKCITCRSKLNQPISADPQCPGKVPSRLSTFGKRLTSRPPTGCCEITGAPADYPKGCHVLPFSNGHNK